MKNCCLFWAFCKWSKVIRVQVIFYVDSQEAEVFHPCHSVPVDGQILFFPPSNQQQPTLFGRSKKQVGLFTLYIQMLYLNPCRWTHSPRTGELHLSSVICKVGVRLVSGGTVLILDSAKSPIGNQCWHWGLWMYMTHMHLQTLLAAYQTSILKLSLWESFVFPPYTATDLHINKFVSLALLGLSIYLH